MPKSSSNIKKKGEAKITVVLFNEKSSKDWGLSHLNLRYHVPIKKIGELINYLEQFKKTK